MAIVTARHNGGNNRSFPNIEYRRFPGKVYLVGYAPLSGVWHIYGTTGKYYVTCQTDRYAGLVCFCALTLAEVSSQLSSR